MSNELQVQNRNLPRSKECFMMKRFTAMLLCALFLCALTACGSAPAGASSAESAPVSAPSENETAAAGGALTGGWTASESPEITPELQAVFDKGMEGLVGASHTPVAYLAHQVVAGTNHCFLCQSAAVVPDAASYYTLVYLYEDLEGNVQVLNIADLDVGAFAQN